MKQHLIVPKYTGFFITLEGGEGTGKSTQAKLIEDYIHKQFHKSCLLTREPGGSPGAEEIRKLLVKEDNAHHWDGMSELLLLMAARRDHIIKTILPALENGEVVICDRFYDSTKAYQGAGHGVEERDMDTIYNMISGGLTPDLTIVLDIPVEEGLKRAAMRGDKDNRYELLGREFHEKVRNEFLRIAKNNPENHRIISANRIIEEVFNNIKPHIDRLFM